MGESELEEEGEEGREGERLRGGGEEWDVGREEGV